VADLSLLINAASAGPWVVAGHSYGGLLALMLAASRPDQLAGLVLVDPALPGLLDWMPGPLRHAYGAAARAAQASRAFSDDPQVRGLVVQAYLASADWAHVRAGYREGLGLAASEAALRHALASPPGARFPTVVLSATEGRPAWIRRRWTALQASLTAGRGAAHLVVPGAGHAVHLDRPALVAEAIMTCGQ